MSIPIRFKMLPEAKEFLPQKAHADDAAWDLRSRISAEVLPGKVTMIPTGLFLEIPVGYEAQIRPRSGLALKHSLTVMNSPGTIDSGYRGEICVLLFNAGDTTFAVQSGDRIAQMVIARLPDVELIQAETLSESIRDVNGFGSTGVH